MSWLPKDSRTLLSTPRSIEMHNLTNGNLWYIFLVFILEIDMKILHRSISISISLYCIIFKVQRNRKEHTNDEHTKFDLL